MLKPKRFALDVGITFTANGSKMLLGFIITVVLGKYLGADGLGLYRITLTIYGITMLFASIGIPSAIVKYIAEFKDNKDKLNKVVSSGIITSLFLGIGFSTLLFFISGIFANIFKMPELPVLVKTLSPIFPFALVCNTLLGFLNGLREMKKYAIVIIIQSILMVIVTSILVYCNFGSLGAVIAIVVSSIGGCFFSIIFSVSHFKMQFANFIPTVKKMLRFGSQVFGAGAINEINNRLDVILIGIFLKLSDVGYYAAAVSLSRFFWLIPLSVQKITYPATSEYWSKKNYDALNTMINKVMKYCTIILVLIGLGIFFFSVDIFTFLFKKDFACSVLPLHILLIGTVIRGSIAQPIGGTLSAIGRPDLSLKISTLMFIINILLDVVLIPIIGIRGAALATTISLSGGAFVNLALIIKKLSIKINIGWYIKIFTLVLISMVLFNFGIHFMNPYLLGCIILICYSVFVSGFLLTKEDKSMFKLLTYLLIPRK
ncbi:Stage V sporulation protein B [subsurface metagenome]